MKRPKKDSFIENVIVSELKRYDLDTYLKTLWEYIDHLESHRKEWQREAFRNGGRYFAKFYAKYVVEGGNGEITIGEIIEKGFDEWYNQQNNPDENGN